MKLRIRFAATLAACILSSTPSHAHPVGDQEPSRLVTVRLSDYSAQLRELAARDFDIAGVDWAENIVDILVDEQEFEALLQIKNIEIIDTTRGFTTAAPDRRYHTYAMVTDRVNDLAQAHATIAAVQSIGKTHEGRDIWAVKVSDNVAEWEADEPTVLFNAMHHSREVMTTEVAMDTLEYLLTNYGSDDKVTGWVDANEIWIVPMVNPDGNNRVWSGSTMWRKNVRGGYGVDLNRNYPYGWNTCNGSSGNPRSDTYRGPSAGSEPETQAVMDFVASIKPVFNISYHSYSELVLYPYGCGRQRAESRDIVEGLGRELAQLIPSDGGRGSYRAGTPWELLYNADGGDIDWMYHEHQVIAYVIELNSRSLGFQPSYSYRQPTVQKLRPAWERVLDRLEQSAISGTLSIPPALRMEDVRVSVKNLGARGGLIAEHGVRRDGHFHVVLAPGMYDVAIRAGAETLHTEQVIVGPEKVDMSLAL